MQQYPPGPPSAIRLVVAFLTLILLPTTPSAGAEPVPDATLVYKTAGDAGLRLHIFHPEGHRAEDSRPAIVFFFGGGWVRGEPAQFFPQCAHLAARGMVAISAEYRTSSGHGTSPRECVLDGNSAIRWVRRHAGELGIDPDRIAAGGGSAGGHVAAATAALSGFDEPDEDLNVSSRPNALVLFNPVFDNGPSGYGHDRVKDYWREFSPLHNLHDSMPPTLVMLGSRDRLIPVATAEDYQQRMQDLERRCELKIYEGAGHGFFNHGRDGGKYRETLMDMDRFLQSLGYLEAVDASGADD